MSGGSASGRPTPDRLLERVRQTIRRNRLAEPGSLLLVGVSGGPDSVFLLHALGALAPELGIRLHVAHLNHGLRGEQSDGDELFTADLARSLDLDVTVERASPDPADRATSPHERCRSWRLDFFRRLAGTLGASATALGHTLDDQAVTILLRLILGGGPGALGGIRFRGPQNIVHPLLEIERSAILSWLGERGLPFRRDPSNHLPRYPRNRVRDGILPSVLEMNPAFLRRAALLSRLLEEDDRLLGNIARPIRHTAVRRLPRGAGITLEGARLATLPGPVLRRVLLEAAVEAGAPRKQLDARHVDRLERLLRGEGGNRVSLPGGMEGVRQSNGLLLQTASPQESGFAERRILVPGVTGLPEIGLAVHAELLTAPAALPGDAATVLLDLDALSGTLRVRPRLAGDRFRPLGFDHARSVKRYLIDVKYPREKRERVPVVFDDEKIVWLAGLRADHRSRVTPASIRLLRLTLRPLETPDDP